MEAVIRRLVTHALTYIAIGGISLLIFVLLFTLVRGEGSADVGREGQIAIHAEAALSATAAVHNGAAQLVLLAEGVDVGWVDPAVLEASIASHAATIEELRRRAIALNERLSLEEMALVSSATDAYATEATTQLTALTNDDADIEAIRTDPALGDRYDEVVSLIIDLRDGRVLGVLAAAEGVGRIADAIRFLVVFVVPATVMVGFRRALRKRRERDQLEIELARQTDINASKDEFVVNLSHELRTPLTGIYGFALSLSDGGAADEATATELAGLIANEASELTRMVDDLIAAGRLQAEQLQYSIGVVDLALEIDSVVEPFVRSGRTIDVHLEQRTACADRHRLRQVLRNLVSNACKHGGDQVEIATYVVDGKVAIAVMDDGPGVSDELEQRLFSRYIHEGQAPILEGSVGLGLSIAKTLTDGMGGALEYSRQSGITVFEVHLEPAPENAVQSHATTNTRGANVAHGLNDSTRLRGPQGTAHR